MWMIGLAANSGPFFMRVNPNAAMFAPNFNDVCEWNSGLFCLHHYLLVSFNAPGGELRSNPNTFNFISHDGQGTPDGWYLRYGLDPLTPGIASQDADGDGISNRDEYLRGSDPTQAEGSSIWLAVPSGLSNLP